MGNSSTRWRAGDPSPNPSGVTKADKAARDLLRAALHSETYRDAWKKSYLRQLEEGNPLILKDYADRVGGKAVDRVEVTAVERPLAPMTSEELIALARSRLKAAAPALPEPDVSPKPSDAVVEGTVVPQGPPQRCPVCQSETHQVHEPGHP